MSSKSAQIGPSSDSQSKHPCLSDAAQRKLARGTGIASNMPDIYAAASVETYFQCKPSLILSTAALLLFSVITVVLAVQTFKSRPKCRFMWIVVGTGALEVAGYVCHMVAAETVNSKAYIAYLILTMLAPNFLALVNYLVTGKIAEQQQLKGRFLSARNIAGTFFAIDWICIVIQGAGSGILASALQSTGTPDASAITRGKTVAVIGLSVQLFFFASFTLVAGHVYRKQPTSADQTQRKPVFICLFVTILLITMRNIYRCIEFGVGWNGYLNTNEKYVYTLDALPIFAAFCTYSLLHFGKYMPALRDGSAAVRTTSAAASVLDSCSSIDQLSQKPASDQELKIHPEFWLQEKDCVEAKGIWASEVWVKEIV